MDKIETIQQTKLAFEFIEKLYFEVSYLIKEIEGLLSEEEEHFVIGRPSGYGISARSSTGLDARYVYLWPLRKLAVFFVPEDATKISRGQTITRFDSDPKVIYLRIVLNEKDLNEPVIYSGVLHEFNNNRDNWPVKVEQAIGHIEYNDTKVFGETDIIDYEDSQIKFKGRIIRTNLFDINTSEDISKMILEPTLKMFRET